MISQNPEMSTRQVADEVGIFNGSAYYVLTALVEKGFVKLGNFKNNPRKGQYACLLTPKGIREKYLLTHSFIWRKREEFEVLKADPNAAVDPDLKLLVYSLAAANGGEAAHATLLAMFQNPETMSEERVRILQSMGSTKDEAVM